MRANTAEKELYGTPRVGGDALSFCARCKMELAHVIISMVGGCPAKVICKTCNSQHRYRRNSAPMAKRTRAKSPTKTVISVSEHWEKKVAEKNRKKMIEYKCNQQFEIGNLIQHHRFGVGVVEEVRVGKKILVLFREGEKILIHGAKP